MQSEADGHPEIKKFISILAETIRASMDELPKYRELELPTVPTTGMHFNAHT